MVKTHTTARKRVRNARDCRIFTAQIGQMMDDGPEADAYEAQHDAALLGDHAEDPVEESEEEIQEDPEEDQYEESEEDSEEELGGDPMEPRADVEMEDPVAPAVEGAELVGGAEMGGPVAPAAEGAEVVAEDEIWRDIEMMPLPVPLAPTPPEPVMSPLHAFVDFAPESPEDFVIPDIAVSPVHSPPHADTVPRAYHDWVLNEYAQDLIESEQMVEHLRATLDIEREIHAGVRYLTPYEARVEMGRVEETAHEALAALPSVDGMVSRESVGWIIAVAMDSCKDTVRPGP